jgi:hypothetical protein
MTFTVNRHPYFKANKMDCHYKQHFKKDISPHWKMTKHIPSKKYSAAVIQLKTGHGYFRSYLVRANPDATNRCLNGYTAIQSPEHLLLSCPNYNEERKMLRKNANLKRQDPFAAYFYGAKKITALLAFIRNTGIATRDWLMEGRRQEDEEAEKGEETEESEVEEDD